MKRERITLDTQKVSHLINRSGKRKKQFLDGMNRRTLSRILDGQPTSLTTAEKLATELDVTVADLAKPLDDQDLISFLPEHWIYEEIHTSAGDSRYIPFCAAIGGYKYIVDGSPTNFCSPIDKLLKWRESPGRKIVLSRKDYAFHLEIHYFYYSSDREQQVIYETSSGIRFFPLVRNADTFSKSAMSQHLGTYVWRRLQLAALENSEILEIEGFEYPEHPFTYLPLVRFYQGHLLQCVPLGARLFERLNSDFRSALIDYLSDINHKRISASVTAFGISITIEPLPPAVYKIGWRDDIYLIVVELVWKTRDNKLARAPWRRDDRQHFVDAINSGKRANYYSMHMPIRHFPLEGEDEDDLEIPPLNPDYSLSKETIDAINDIDNVNRVEILFDALITD